MADMSHPVDLLPAFDWKPDVVFLLAASVGRLTCEQAGSLAIATNDFVRLWDLSNGRERARCEGLQMPVNCVAFAPDGATLATGSTTGGLWVSEDAGATWQCLSRDLPPIAVVRIA